MPRGWGFDMLPALILPLEGKRVDKIVDDTTMVFEGGPCRAQRRPPNAREEHNHASPVSYSPLTVVGGNGGRADETQSRVDPR